MSGPVLTAAEMRSAEQSCAVPLDLLMERAGTALADLVQRFRSGRAVLVACGPGNNGGDGYVAARILRERGVDVRVASLGEPATELAMAARKQWGSAVEALGSVRGAPVFVDCLFGTGLGRALSDDYRLPLHRLAGVAEFVIAADLPSGVATDDGAVLGAVAADVTLTFGAVKPAHLLQPAAALCGTVLVADIGIAVASHVGVLSRPQLSAPGPGDHKYTRGMVAVVAGAMPGAATLSVTAAAHLAGYTVLCGKGDAPAAIVRRGFAATIGDDKLGAILTGPGLSDTPENRERLRVALASPVALVLDAGALGLVTPEDLARRAVTIITPHEGEFVRLFGSLPGSKIERARAAAERCGATVLLKGADTVIASPCGRVTLCPAASPWLATAGTGDVLGGIIAGLLARGLDAHDAAAAGVWLHGEAASRAGPAFIADDLCRHLAPAIGMASR
jgi:hydroxyethylthiazole kinase-like uncharacterized protein yjeF